MNNYMIWMIGLALLSVIVTALRTKEAKENSNEVKSHNAEAQQENENKLSETLKAENLSADLAFSTECAAISVDERKGKMLVISKAVENGKKILNLSEIKDVVVIDRSDDYRHCQEMERLRNGVERNSLYSPYGNFSGIEVKEGHERFKAYTGALVFGLKLDCRDSEELIPLFVGDGAVFWNEGEKLTQCRAFAERLSKLIENT